MDILLRGFSQQHFKVIRVGETLIRATTGVETLLEVLVLLSTDILPALIMVQGHQILSAATFAHTMVSPRRGLNRVCREGFRELPGEASFLTLVAEAYSGPEM